MKTKLEIMVMSCRCNCSLAGMGGLPMVHVTHFMFWESVKTFSEQLSFGDLQHGSRSSNPC